MLPPKEKHPSSPVVQRQLSVDADRRKLADLATALEMLASREDVSLSGLVRVTAQFEEGTVAVIAYRQGARNGSSIWTFSRADLAARPK